MRKLTMRQGGERVYIAPVSFKYTDMFTLDCATSGFLAMLRGLWLVLKSWRKLYVYVGECERPYAPGCYNPALTWNKTSNVSGIWSVVWYSLMQVLLLLHIILLDPRWLRVKLRYGSLVIGEACPVTASIYGYMLAEDLDLVTHPYLDVSDDVVQDVLDVGIAVGPNRDVFFTDPEDLPVMLAWIKAHKTEDTSVTFLRNVDT